MVQKIDLLEGLRGDTGSGPISFPVVVFILIGFLELILIGGNVASTANDVESAARQAARQATLAPDQTAASGLLDAVVDGALADRKHSCTPVTSQITDSTQFVPGGWVVVSVSCTVALSDLGQVPFPGTLEIERSAIAAIDRYRFIAGSSEAEPTQEGTAQ